MRGDGALGRVSLGAVCLVLALSGCATTPGASPSETAPSEAALPAPSAPPGPAAPSDAPAATPPAASTPPTVVWSEDEAIGVCKDAVNARGALLDWSTVSTSVEEADGDLYTIRFEYEDGSASTSCAVSGTVEEPNVRLRD